jgi:hypothetical protein
MCVEAEWYALRNAEETIDNFNARGVLRNTLLD